MLKEFKIILISNYSVNVFDVDSNVDVKIQPKNNELEIKAKIINHSSFDKFKEKISEAK